MSRCAGQASDLAGITGAEHAGLQAYIERDWQNFGTTAATAEADLRQLAVDLGCEAQPRLPYRPEGLLLVRGAAAIFR